MNSTAGLSFEEEGNVLSVKRFREVAKPGKKSLPWIAKEKKQEAIWIQISFQQNVGTIVLLWVSRRGGFSST